MLSHPPQQPYRFIREMERKRAARACDYCHRKKIRCNGDRPCDVCRKLDAECTFTSTGRRKSYRQGYVEALEDRVAQLSRILQSKHIPLPVTSPRLLEEENYVRVLQVLETEGPNGMGASTSASVVGEVANSHYGIKRHQPMVEMASEEQAVMVRPELIHYVFDQLYNLVPFFHRKLFELEMQQPTRVSPLLLTSMYALASHFALAYGDLQSLQISQESADALCSAAMRLVPNYLEQPHLTTIQACLILSILCISKDNVAMCWLFIGIAKRFALRLGLNQDQPQAEVSWVDGEIRRRTWWVCFALDRMASNRLQRPHAIRDELVGDQVFPASEHFFQTTDPMRKLMKEDRPVVQRYTFATISEHLDHSNLGMDGFASMIILLGLYGKIVNYVQTAGENQFSKPFFPVRQQLLNELNQFEKSLPPYVLDLTGLSPANVHADYYRIFICLKLSYCRLMLKCPVISTLDLAYASRHEPAFFWQCVEDAQRILSISNVMARNRLGRGYSAIMGVPLFYASLVFLAAIVANPSSEHSLMFLQSADALMVTLNSLERAWSSIHRYSSCLNLMRKKYGLLTERLASVRPSLSALMTHSPSVQPGSSTGPSGTSGPSAPGTPAAIEAAEPQPSSAGESSTGPPTEEQPAQFGKVPPQESLAQVYEAFQYSHPEAFPLLFDPSVGTSQNQTPQQRSHAQGSGEQQQQQQQ